ncbi:MAG TPA: twitching motility protein PilT [Candidatus Thermoplasmatota archaeon]|nr:twitching motility protein PilT [Candidatus Thermoplasmatota archaeon]
MATPVVLDTNALLLPFTSRVNLDAQLDELVGPHECIVPSSILGELKMLAQHESNASRHAKTALKLVQRYRIERTALPGDDGLLEVARKLKAVVVTNDRLLQEECARSGLKVAVARETGRLAWRGEAS